MYAEAPDQEQACWGKQLSVIAWRIGDGTHSPWHLDTCAGPRVIPVGTTMRVASANVALP